MESSWSIITDDEDLDGGSVFYHRGIGALVRAGLSENTEHVAEAAAATTVAVSHFQSAENTPAVSLKRCFNSTIMFKYAEELCIHFPRPTSTGGSLTDTSLPGPERSNQRPVWLRIIALLSPHNTSGSQSCPVRLPVSIKWNTIHKISIRAGLPGGRREENRGVTAPL